MSRLATLVASDRAAVDNVLDRVETMLDPAASGSFSASEHPLTAIIRAVSAPFGLKPEAGSKPLAGETPPEAIERLARGAGLIVREMPLEAGWRERSPLPMIARHASSNYPIALLPAQRGWRHVDGRNPRDPSRLPEALVGELADRVFVVSPALPDGVMTTRDLFFYGFSNKLGDLAAFVLMSLVAGLLMTLLPVANMAITDLVIPGRDVGLLNHVIAMLVALLVTSLVANAAASTSQLRMNGRTALMLRAAAADRMIRVTRAQQTGKAIPPAAAALITRSMESWHRAMWGLVLSVSGAVLVALPSLGLIMQIAPLGALLCLLAMAAALGFAAFVAHRQTQILFSGAASPTSWISLSYETLSQVETVRAFGAENRFFRMFAESFLALKERFLTSDRTGSAVSALEAALSALVLTIGIGVAVIFHKNLPVGAAVVFTTALMVVTGAAVTLVSSFMTASSLGMQERLIQPLLDAVPAPYRNGFAPATIGGAVELIDVTVRRAAGARPILDRVSLRIEKGEHIGIVGKSGSGKSTLLRVILGLETPESGGVRIDGVDMSLLDGGAVRRRVGVVGQAGKLFPGSIFENICAGLKLTHEEAWEALRLAAFESDVRAMPLGLSTPIGDADPVLSGGQVQRVLLARAFAQRPALMVLDEATSALDPKTEAHVANSINALKATVITVAHRLDTVRHCNRIFVLHEGRVVESGSFDALVASGGRLADFVGADARAKRPAGNPVGDSLRKLETELRGG